MLLTRLDPWSVLLGAVLWPWCSPAAAEESDAARLFRQGRALVVDGRFAEACPKLEQSQQLEPRLGTQLNIAFCHEQLGKLATAWSGFLAAASTARREGDLAREQFATARARALAPRVPRLELRVAEDGEPPALQLDGALLAPSTWAEELPVDPGPHVLVATQGHENDAGEEYWRTTLVLRESEHVNVSVPAVPRATTQPGAPAPAPAVRAGGRFVYELGAFVGLLVVDTKQSTPEGGAASIQTVVQDQDGNAETRSCFTLVCDYPSLGGSASFVVGVTGFFGYAPAPSVGLGVRFLLGPRAGGGGLVAAGPSASFLLAERFRISPAVLFGTASHVEQDTVQLTTPTGFNGVDSPLHGTLGFSLGVGSELGWTVFSNPTGSVVVQATPLYLYGSNGTAWSLPLGATYHWN